MAVSILLVSLLLILFAVCVLNKGYCNLNEQLIKAVLIFSLTVVIITELTTLVSALNFQSVLLSWTFISILISYLLFLKRERLLFLISSVFYRRKWIHPIGKRTKILVFIVFFILLFIFLQGLFYPPNNWDSMTYHMARIPNWISHQSVSHYPTHILRQLYQPPFSEFLILHLSVLNGSDYLANSVQLFFLIFSAIVLISIIDLYGLHRRYKLIAFLLAVTIPEVILQASSTQNDIVVSFFILSSFYYAVKNTKKKGWQNYFFFGLSIGLATLTKATAYIFLFPILILYCFTEIHVILTTKKLSYITYTIIPILLFLSINLGHYTRNYKLSNNALGIDHNESILVSNESMNAGLLFSNIIKNAGMHLGPYPINMYGERLIYRIHELIGVPINSKETNFINLKYATSINIPNHEDSASNSAHFLLILMSVIIILIHNHRNKIFFNSFGLYLILIIFQAIVFSLYLKWQPWHTRLHTPLFLLAIPIICYAISLHERHLAIFNKVSIIIIGPAFLIILFNASRPVFINKHTANISLFDCRWNKYFANRPVLKDEYSLIRAKINKMGYRNIGLLLETNDWEYPLFSDIFNININPVHLKVTNMSAELIPVQKSVDCIVSTTIKKSAIRHQGKIFKNQFIQNKIIWMYK